MGSDITRTTFNPLKHYSAVRWQQGRPSLDADWNEQADITARRAEITAADLLSRTGAPRDNAGFLVIPLPLAGASSDLGLAPGRMYVDGILCELESNLAPIAIVSGKQIQLTNLVLDGRELAAGQWVEISAAATGPAPIQTQVQPPTASGQITLKDDVSGFGTSAQLRRITTYLTQADNLAPAALPTSGLALVYLDVWERTITALEDGEIRDPALGLASGADTTTRSKTVWQVKFQPVAANATCATAPDFPTFTPQSTGQLAARAEPTAASTSACILPPRAGFRRLENQLYRVEVQTGGNLAGGKPTFKWSRDNGSVVTAIVSPAPVLTGTSLTFNVSSLGRDQTLGLATGQWVELTEDGRELAGQPGILVQLTATATGPQGPVLTADTSAADPVALASFINGFTNNTVRNPKVRRWDESGAQVSTGAPGGDVPIQEGVWIDLESGVQVFFAAGGNYATGDHWLVPARTVTGDVDWPRDSAGNPQFRPPQGIRHHYCRLGIVNFGTTPWILEEDCRQLFAPLAETGIHIKSVFLTNPSGVSPNAGVVLNDSMVALQDLAGGISIQCDTPIDPVSLLLNPSLSKPTCYVTIDVPQFAGANQLPFAAQSTLVAATLSLDAAGGGTIIDWAPTTPAATWIQNQLAQILAQTPAPGPMLARLTLKGNFIWAAGNPSMFLDGDAFGGPVAPDASGNQRTGLFMPSGDGRRGGDFEMWFWLISLPSVVVSPTAIDFGAQAVGTTSSPAASITLTNNTKSAVTISSIAPGGDFAATTTCPLSPGTLAAGASCTISATFTPTLAGPRPGNITVTHNASGSPLTIPLSGTGLAPTLQASATSLNFAAALGEETADTLTLTNIGSSFLNISAITLSGAASRDFSTNAPQTAIALAPGQSLTVIIGFAPTAIGVRSANLTISHNASGSPLVITLNGRGFGRPRGGGPQGGILTGLGKAI
ncbi:MAG: choice-of-anchor D domain-containing protein [Deltaproteobacteria bacterium]|nr:choice-of-anchor D domain-containing protein [Deltaproteobacteria bacterium]MBV8293319.1 choice-of-anchor D domain-containing protein [Mycobacterium sp.]